MGFPLTPNTATSIPDLGPGALLVPVYLGSANSAAPTGVKRLGAAILKRSGRKVSHTVIVVILGVCLAILLLLFLSCYLVLRRRKLRRTLAGDKEMLDLVQVAGYESDSYRTLSVRHSNDFQRGYSGPAPLISRPQPLSEIAAPVSPPTRPYPRLTEVRNTQARAPSRPQPLLLRPVNPDRDSWQSGDSFTRLNTIRRAGRVSRNSLLPNPWDSDAKPQRAPFEPVIYRLSSFSRSARATDSSRRGRPRAPRGLPSPPVTRGGRSLQ